jgi:hypothetical protein
VAAGVRAADIEPVAPRHVRRVAPGCSCPHPRASRAAVRTVAHAQRALVSASVMALRAAEPRVPAGCAIAHGRRRRALSSSAAGAAYCAAPSSIALVSVPGPAGGRARYTSSTPRYASQPPHCPLTVRASVCEHWRHLQSASVDAPKDAPRPPRRSRVDASITTVTWARIRLADAELWHRRDGHGVGASWMRLRAGERLSKAVARGSRSSAEEWRCSLAACGHHVTPLP